ncbi:MAG: hypothetical protein CL920_19135 [Deltaproteobacteria bacterium]|nr:hypothetical protein [Deltaproteobacteria bacterium]MBU50801.1 hypothetical protein [Deltaproteobacteria bacterium]
MKGLVGNLSCLKVFCVHFLTKHNVILQMVFQLLRDRQENIPFVPLFVNLKTKKFNISPPKFSHVHPKQNVLF